jgi:tetratricopeptide (TPR) repeat protein
VKRALAGLSILCTFGGGMSAQSEVLTTAAALESYARGDRSVVVSHANGRLPPIWTIAEDLNRLSKTTTLPTASITESAREIASFAIEAARALEAESPASVCQMMNSTRSRWIAAGTQTEFARRWHRAAIALALRNDCHDAADQAVTAALTDFPNEARFRLDRAVIAEQQLSEAFADGGRPSGRDLRDAESRFKIAMAVPPVAAEAALHWARVNALLGQHEQAIGFTADALASPDPRLRYLAHLFRGWSLAALGKAEDADAEFGKALAIVPGAQSATLARAAAAFRKRDAERAEQMVASLASRRDAAADPWWTYSIGEGRNADQLIAELRQVIR